MFMATGNSHDQNFKNLILDYPLQALAFFAADEAPANDDNVSILPIRQEQLKERLGNRFVNWMYGLYRHLRAPYR
jgi:hypothetical protein